MVLAYLVGNRAALAMQSSEDTSWQSGDHSLSHFIGLGFRERWFASARQQRPTFYRNDPPDQTH